MLLRCDLRALSSPVMPFVHHSTSNERQSLLLLQDFNYDSEANRWRRLVRQWRRTNAHWLESLTRHSNFTWHQSVTWQWHADDVYGHWFRELISARMDLIVSATNSLNPFATTDEHPRSSFNLTFRSLNYFDVLRIKISFCCDSLDNVHRLKHL